MTVRKKKNTFLFKFLVSYIIILAVSLSFIMVIYGKTVVMFEDYMQKSNLNMLEQTRDIIDRHLKELDHTIERVALDAKIISLAYLERFEKGSPDIELLIDAVNGMSAYKLPDNFLKEFYIYFNASDIILTSSLGNTNMKLLYGNYFSFNDMSYDEWISVTAGQIHQNNYLATADVTFNGRKHPVITKLQSIPLENPRSNRGCIMAFIDTEALDQLLRKIGTGSGGYTYILDGSNQIITSVCPDGSKVDFFDITFDESDGVMKMKISGEEMLVSYTASSLTEWKYITAVPYGFVMQKVNYIRTIVLIGAVLVLIIGTLLSCFFSYRNSKPIKEIYDSLKEIFGDSSDYKNEYSFLSRNIYNLIHNNQSLSKKLDENLPLVKDAFIRRLLHGGFSDQAEIKTNLSRLNIQISGHGFVAAILKISGHTGIIHKKVLKELDLTRLIINRLIEENYGNSVLSCDLDELRIALLFFVPYTDVERITRKVENTASELAEALQNQLKIHVSFAAGSVCNSLLEIGYSFIEAKQALGYLTNEQEKRVIWYKHISCHADLYHYSTDMKNKLMELTESGNAEEADRLMKMIYVENFQRRNLSVGILQLLLFQLTGTLAELTQKLGLELPDLIYKDFSQAEDVEFEFHEIEKSFRVISEMFGTEKDKNEDVLCKRILMYVSEVYMQEDLTLYNVASHFNMTETYLYHFIKKKTGMTFASHLEKLRMDHACCLLSETDITVCDVASQVGYGSVHSFRRAFKRCKGYKPSDLRNLSYQNQEAGILEEL